MAQGPLPHHVSGAPVTACTVDADTLSCIEVSDGETLGLKPGAALPDILRPDDASSIAVSLKVAGETELDLDAQHTDGRPLRIRARAGDDTGHIHVAIVDASHRNRFDDVGLVEAAMLRALSRATTLADAVQPFVETLGRALSLRAAELWLTDHRTGVIRRVASTSRGFPPFHLERVMSELDESLQEGFAGDAARSGRLIWASDLRHEPRFVRRREAILDGIHCAIAVPLRFNTRELGAVILLSSECVPEDPGATALLERLASQLSLLVTNIRRDDLLQRSQRRLRFLTDLSRVLARSLDPETVANAVVSALVPGFADHAVLEHTGGGSTVCAVRTLEGTDPAPFTELGRQFEPDREGRFRLADDAPLRSLGCRHALVTPLEERGRTVGRLVLLSADDPFDEEEEMLARETSRRVSATLEHAQVFAQRSHIAKTLQSSLLPPSLPRIPGIDVAARYRAAGDGIDLGGDFYDLFPTGETSWAVLVGDVQGKGPEAAAVTALARYTLRAAAVRARRPSKILELLNTTLLTNEQTDRLCTVAMARVTARADSASITLALGGHPQAILKTREGTVSRVGVPGQVLGCFERISIPDEPIPFSPGDVFVLYTDGVTEARSPSGAAFGEQHLLDVLSSISVHAEAEEIAATIERAAVEWQHGVQADDIAILVLKRADPRHDGVPVT